ncbi:MAG TPA: acyl-CoA dehydrogenase family protein [Acidimicrobiales bacterium]|nr:acyl-CoA dehydrogenase family protein [Acidimicrobiales bacterium]
MDLELSDDQVELQQALRTVLERECPVSLVRAVVEEGAETEDLWKTMVGLDWPSLAIDTADGGLGLGAVELAILAEELGRALSPTPLLATATQFVPAITAAGDDAQRARFLGAVAAEGLAGTLAIAEASGSFDPVDVAATATPDGDGFVLQGEKHDVFDAGRADELVVVARLPQTSGAQGIGLFVVPRSATRSTRLAAVDATRRLGTVLLDGVRVDASRVLGDPTTDGPLRALRCALLSATAALAAEVVGTSQAIFDIVHAYVLTREQFGVKIGSFQAIKHKLADLYVALESARTTVWFAAAAIAEDDERAPLAVSMAKSSAGDCQRLMAKEGIQCLGGIGYTWEHDMHLYVKRVKTSAALFGTAVEHRARIATAIGL